MSDYRLTPKAALGEGTLPITLGGFELAEVADLSIASLASRRGEEKTCQKRAADLLGTPLPTVGGFVAGDSDRAISAFWTGPEQWFLLSGTPDLAEKVKQSVGDSGSVSEQDNGWACLELKGQGLHSVLERLTACDARVLESGQAVRTTVEHMGCFIVCLESDRHLRLFVARSFARSLHHAVLTALKSTLALAALT